MNTLYRHHIRHKSQENYCRLTYCILKRNNNVQNGFTWAEENEKRERVRVGEGKKREINFALARSPPESNGLKEMKMNIFFLLVLLIFFFRSLHVAITCQLIHRAATPTCRSRRCNINRRRHQQQQVAGRFSAPQTLVHTHTWKNMHKRWKLKYI